MNTVTILDFSMGEVHVYQYPENLPDDIDISQWIEENTQHKTKDCQWMCTNELILTVHPVKNK